MSQGALLLAHGITKTFSSGVALADARLTIGRGEVHALIGQNGAGKSTLIKILTGVYHRDGGNIVFDGREVSFRSPQQAQLNGISTIYQEVNLVPLRSIAENIFLGREPRRFGLIHWHKMNSDAAALLAKLGIHIDVSQALNRFNIAIQQMVAIARAISFNSKLVIMDEPTSSLDDREVETLFGVIRNLKANGVSVIFVSHRLDELYAICDRVTIMRDGRTVDEKPMAEVSRLELVSKMLGREITAATPTRMTDSLREPLKPAILEAKNVTRGRRLNGANLTVRPGEIVGLAGLLGSGRTELARAIFGADRIESGEIVFSDKQAQFNSPGEAIRAGMGLCSEDRKAEGIVPNLSVRENMTLATLPDISKSGVVLREREQEIVERFIKRLRIKTAGPEQKIKELSGGNQQKVLLARWLCRNPKLLILDEPTRGIDIGAKGEIQSLVHELAEQGLGVLWISSDLDELIAGCHRVVVLREGRTVAELKGTDITEDAIMSSMAHGAHAGGDS